MTPIVVLGKPETQGNKTGYYNEQLGRVVMVEGRRPDSRKRFKSWRARVTDAGTAWALEHGLARPIEGPLAVRLTFSLPRPKSHPQHRRTWPTAPRHDIEKLARAVFDALTGIVWKDDGQIVTLVAHKDFDAPAGVTVEVFRADQNALDMSIDVAPLPIDVAKSPGQLGYLGRPGNG